MITSTTSRVQYTANGSTTVFAFPFLVLEASHLIVVDSYGGTDTTKTYGTDFTISGLGDSTGGNVVFGTAPTTSHLITIYRVVPYTQTTDYVPNDDFPAETHEAALDKLTMEVQQLDDRISRALRYPASEPTSVDGTLAAATARASTLMGFDGSGNIFLYPFNPGTLTVTIPSVIDTAHLQDGAVTGAKLNSTLDLSGKTILNFPALTVTPLSCVNNMDFSALPLKSWTFKDGEIARRELSSTCVYQSGTAPYLMIKQVGVNLPSTTDLVLTGTGVADGVYVYQGTKNGGDWWAFGTSYSVMKDANTGVYTIYADIVGSSVFLASDETETGHVTNPCDSIWGGSVYFRQNIQTVEVSGTVKATQFIGDGSLLTGIGGSSGTAQSAVTDLPGYFTGYPANTGIDEGLATYGRAASPQGNGIIGYITSDRRSVLFTGYNSAAGILTPQSTAYTASLRRAVVRAGKLSSVTTLYSRLNPSGSTVAFSDASPLLSDSKFSKLHVGLKNLFVLDCVRGLFYAMGINGKGQLGQADTTNRPYLNGVQVGTGTSSYQVVAFSATPQQEAAGASTDNATVALLDYRGKVWTLGYNGNGQCGTASTTDQSAPYNDASWLFNAKTVQQVLTVGYYTWVLTSDGYVYGCGLNGSGALGDGSTTQRTNFVLMTGTGTTHVIKQIFASGGYYSATDTVTFYGMKSDGSIVSCGYNANGEMGVNSATTSFNTLQAAHSTIGALTKLYVFGGNGGWCLGIKTTGAPVTWGYNGQGQLGDGSTTSRISGVTPTALQTAMSGTSVTDAIGVNYKARGTTVVLLANGSVYASGYGGNGEIADGSVDTPIQTFKKVQTATAISQIACASEGGTLGSVFYRDTSSKVWANGYNAHYQLAMGHVETVSTVNPVTV